MANRAKEKGDRFERHMVKVLNEAGIAAQRVPLSGAVAGFPGDVTLDNYHPKIIAQCKHFANPFKRMFELAEQNRVTIVSQEHYGDIFFLMMLKPFLEWWRSGSDAFPSDTPVAFTPFAECARWLDYEDILFVKRNRGDPFVLMKTRTAIRFIHEPRFRPDHI